jgi:hypothetical protein
MTAELIAWYTDLGAAISAAAEAVKPVFIDFWAYG